MKTAEYDFLLPPELIASRPSPRRDHSRLMVLHRDGELEHRNFYELPLFMAGGDLLLLNNTKVFPARLCGRKPTGGRFELLLVDEIYPGTWSIMSRERYSGPLKISGDLDCTISEGRTAAFSDAGRMREQIWKSGQMPLPPYIKRSPDESDKERYQTVYAKTEGSIAAPTAGLHFTPELLASLIARGVTVRAVTLHVGTGTFRPVKAEDVEDHRMDREYFEFERSLLKDVQQVKAAGNRVFAVGTTTTRTIEGYRSGRCSIIGGSNDILRGYTDIFIHEGYRPQAVDCLITNFHLPRSTPCMLTAAFAGRRRLLEAYRTAIEKEYRFFSYGDAMLVL